MQKEQFKEQAANSGFPWMKKTMPFCVLQEDAKITVREIAGKIHLSTTPVHERIKRMEEAGVILQYATLDESFQDEKRANGDLLYILKRAQQKIRCKIHQDHIRS